MYDLYRIHAWLPDRLETPATIGEKLLRTLDALSLIDPAFNPWYIVDLGCSWDELIRLLELSEQGKTEELESPSIEEARGKITAMIEAGVSLDDYDEPDPSRGYQVAASTSNIISPMSISLKVDAGAKQFNTVHMEIGTDHNFPTHPSLLTYPLFKSALITMMSVWPSPVAVANIFNSTYSSVPRAAGVPLLPETGYHIPWIGYLCPEHARNVDPPCDMLTETAPDGGLLMSATHEPFDPANVEHMTRAKAILEVLKAHVDRGYGRDGE